MNAKLKIFAAAVALFSLFVGLFLYSTDIEKGANKSAVVTEGEVLEASGADIAAFDNASYVEEKHIAQGGAFVLDESYEPIPGNASELLAALDERAKAGDAKASFAIFLKLDDCYRKVNNALSSQELATYQQAGIAEARLNQIESAISDCENITTEQYENMGQWLERAADDGMLTAQLLYASDPESIVGDASEMLRSPDRVKKYKSKAMTYLSVAAQQGSVDAIVRLGNAYNTGILVSKDPVRGYAYYYAAQLAYPDAVSQTRLRGYENLLTADQINNAINHGRGVYAECCSP